MAEVLSLSLLLGPLLFNSTDATPVLQCLHLTSRSSITQAESHLQTPIQTERCVRDDSGPLLQKLRHRGAEEGEYLDTTLTYGQGSAGVNTSWELESTHSMVVLDLHASLNQ